MNIQLLVVGRRNIQSASQLKMFSSLFGKRRSSPVEDETPPIPGPRSDEGFEIVDPTVPRGGLYPNVSGVSAPELPYPRRPAPPKPTPRMNSVDQTFHYLQGVPFALSRELQIASNKESFTTEIGDMLAFLTSKVNMNGYNYEFAVEKSVLKEC